MSCELGEISDNRLFPWNVVGIILFMDTDKSIKGEIKWHHCFDT